MIATVMKRDLNWMQLLALNSYALGLSTAAGIFTPILLPYLVVAFMPPDQKNTYLAAARVIGLAAAMLVQPLAGLFSDRCTARLGRRRPFITFGALGSALTILLIGFSTKLAPAAGGADLPPVFGVTAAYALLVGGSVLLHFFSNIAQGAQQGLIPDIVPLHQHGRAAGVKASLELLAIFLVLLAGPLIDRGRIFTVVGIIMAGYLVTMIITNLGVKEVPLTEKPAGSLRGPILRAVALTAIFVSITQAAIWLVNFSGSSLTGMGASQAVKIALVGLAGLAGMAGSILVGVYLGARVGIGPGVSHPSFVWWIVNRLLFLAAVGSIQGFIQYYLRDVIQAPNPAAATSRLLAVVGFCLIPSALISGALSDRFGRKRIAAAAGWLAAAGALLLLFARDLWLLNLSGAILGLGTGAFMATNWALGTSLVPTGEAGRYLGISNLAGAGAGIVGAGIGGPLADFFNLIEPGLGYLVIFSIYTVLILLSVAVLRQIKATTDLP